MARIRSLKPDFCQSEAIAALTIPTRLHFAMLWTYADDDGRGVDNPRLIKGALWPLDDAITAEVVESYQDELHRAGRITRYEVGGKRFFEVANFSEHQKPQRKTDSKLPAPSEGTPVPLAEDSVSTRGGLTPVVVGVGVDVEGGEQERAVVPSDTATYPPDFEAWYSGYPRKTAKKDAHKAFRQALKGGASVERLTAGLDRWVAAWGLARTEVQFIPYPASWLRDGCYDDECPSPPQARSRVSAKQERNDGILDKFARGIA